MGIPLKVLVAPSCLIFATPWTVACQAPRSMEFSRQESWSEFPFPSPGWLPITEIEPRFPALPTNSLRSEPPGDPTEPDSNSVSNT